jgi:hypothetical protein
MTEPRPAPPRSAAGLAARLTTQADGLREALRLREQRAAADGPEHDHGLHNLANRLLAVVAAEQPPTEDAVARLVRDAEPLREALLLREDAAAAVADREVDWELHSLAYRLLTTVDLLSVNYPDVSPAGSRFDDRPFSAAVADTVTGWPADQRARLAEELGRSGAELPEALATALRPGTTA